MSYLFQSRTSGLVRNRKCKRMVFLTAICGESLCRVYLLCDAHLVSASSDGIRQPCLGSRLLLESRANFFFKSACLRGKLYICMYIYVYENMYINMHLCNTHNRFFEDITPTYPRRLVLVPRKRTILHRRETGATGQAAHSSV